MWLHGECYIRVGKSVAAASRSIARPPFYLEEEQKLTKKQTKNAPRAPRKKAPEAMEIKPRRLTDLLEKALEAFERKLNGDGYAPSLGDYIRLLQLEREMELETNGPKEIRVTWVEPGRTPSSDQ